MFIQLKRQKHVKESGYGFSHPNEKGLDLRCPIIYACIKHVCCGALKAPWPSAQQISGQDQVDLFDFKNSISLLSCLIYSHPSSTVVALEGTVISTL